MPDKRQLGGVQAVSLLLLSRLFTLLLYAPAEADQWGTVGMLAFLGAGVSAILLGQFLLALIHRCGATDLLTLCDLAGPLWGKSSAAVACAVLLLGTVEALVNFQYFLSLAVYPGLGYAVFLLALVAAAAYGVWMGIEALSRFAVPVALLALLALLMASVALLGRVETVYLQSPLRHGWPPVWRAFLSAVLHNSELLVFLLLAGNCPNGGRGVFTRAMLGSIVCYQLTLLLATGTLGSFGAGQRFPVYTMMATAELSILQRLDLVHLVVWIFLAWFKCALYLSMARHCLHHLAPRMGHGPGIALLAAAAAGAALFLMPRMERLLLLWNFQSAGLPFVAAVLVLPAGAALLAALRRRGEGKA